jgi:alkyl hydroperoxide reductase subunit AhpC
MRSHPRDFTPVCTTYVAVPGNTVVIVVVVAVAGVVVPGQLCH